MVEILKHNFVEFMVISAACLGIICLTFGVSYNNKLEREQEVEMAKLGCQKEMLPGGYHNWKCPAKDRQ